MIAAKRLIREFLQAGQPAKNSRRRKIRRPPGVINLETAQPPSPSAGQSLSGRGRGVWGVINEMFIGENMNGITAQVVTASQMLVDSLLEMNTKNRNLKKTIVDLYVNEIKAGRWVTTNQGVGVTASGVLSDGQHRLMAIKKCGYPPVQFILVRGLSEAAQLATDTGAKRTAHDLLEFAMDERVHKHSAAITRLLYASQHGDRWASIPVHELIEQLNEHREEIAAIVKAPRSARFFPAACLAGFVRVAKQTSRTSEVCEFVRSVEDGEGLTKDMPAWHLRNYVSTCRGSGGGMPLSLERFAKTTKATMMFLEGRKMGVLRA